MCVLLVEDEPLIREIMAESLMDAGYEVFEVENGQLAVEIVRNAQKAFTVLVTDFHMPGGVDGAQVAEAIRKTVPAIPVIIASGRPDVLQPSWQTDHGYRFLRKPYRPAELVALVRSLAGDPTP